MPGSPETAIGFTLVYATAAVLGQAFQPLHPGVRPMAGWALHLLCLFVLTAVLGVGVAIASGAVLALAAAGAVLLSVRAARAVRAGERAWGWPFWSHAAVFAAGTAAAYLLGPERYVPLNWDELSHWVTYTRQVFVADTLDHPDMRLTVLGYVPGWPLAQVFPQVVLQRFSPEASLGAGLALAAVFVELVHATVLRIAAVDASGSGPDRRIPWAFALAATAMLLWIAPFPAIPPDSLLIEQPQILATTGAFLVLVAGAGSDETAERWAVLAAGLTAAAAYVLKVAMVTALPGLAVAALWLLVRRRPWADAAKPAAELAVRAAACGALILGPAATAYGLWRVFGQSGGGSSCAASPVAWLIDLVSGHVTPSAETSIVGAFFDRLGGFAADEGTTAFGFVLVAGALVSIRGVRGAWVMVLGVGGYVVTYLFALGTVYELCSAGHERAALSSLERYAGVAFAVAGWTFAVLGAGWAGRYVAALAGRAPSPAAVAGGLGLVAIGLGAMLGVRAEAGFAQLAQLPSERHGDTFAYVEKRRPIVDSVGEIRDFVAAVGADWVPNILIVAQKSDGYQKQLLRYFTLNDDRGGPLHWARVMEEHSWWPDDSLKWSFRRTPEELAAYLLSADIVWPRFIDAYVGPVLGRFADTQDCRDDPRLFILVRTGEAGRPFRCFALASLIESNNRRAGGGG